MSQRKSLAVFFLIVCLSWIAMSATHAEVVDGKDYTILKNPQPTQDSSKIEVLEFFWYGCPHCYSLHPHLKSWLTNVSGDISFRYVPAILRPNWVTAAKIFYAIEAMGIVNDLHDKVYDAIHRDKVDLNNEAVLFDWVEKQGIDKKKFEATYSSFSVQNQVSKSTQMTRQYQLSGVPALVVNGKYLTSGRMGGTPQDTIRTLDALITKARSEK